MGGGVKNLRYCLTMLCHGLQIGKDQKGDNQRDENCYQFNNIGFIGDITICADTPEGMQKLLNVVHGLVWNANQCEENVFVSNR